MTHLPAFMFLNNKHDLPHREFMLYTPYPFHLFEIIWCGNEWEEMEFLAKDKQGRYVPIAGYRIFVVWRSTITGRVPLTKDFLTHLNDTLLRAAQYYYDTRINPNEGRYRRFKAGDGVPEPNQ